MIGRKPQSAAGRLILVRLAYNAKDRIPEPDAAQQAIFDQGHEVGALEIQEGGQASLEFLRIHFADAPEAERQKLRGQLERSCGQDTEGMIWIVDALRRLIG